MKINLTVVVFSFVILVLPVFSDLCFAGPPPLEIGPDNPVSRQGYVEFLLKTDKTYRNGKGDGMFMQTLLQLPGLAACLLVRTDTSVGILFNWKGKDAFERSFQYEFPDLPGPGAYFLQFTWDADKGLSQWYMNGIPLRVSEAVFEPWKINGKATAVDIPTGANRVERVLVFSRYLSREQAICRVPRELYGKGAELLGVYKNPISIDTGKRKGKLLYESRLNNRESAAGWVLEGPGIITFEKGKMIMRSRTPNPLTRGTGHVNFWCPRDFPGRFIAEWEFEPLTHHGCSIVFFAAKGENGEDIFDPALPKRDGAYPQYTSGAILNYHILYFANLPRYMTARNYSNLRKGNRYYELGKGPVAILPGTRGFQRMTLIKDGEVIRLFANGSLCLEFQDPGSDRWGPVLNDGKIGFRQMAVTTGAYRNFSVWHLK